MYTYVHEHNFILISVQLIHLLQKVNLVQIQAIFSVQLMLHLPRFANIRQYCPRLFFLTTREQNYLVKFRHLLKENLCPWSDFTKHPNFCPFSLKV